MLVAWRWPRWWAAQRSVELAGAVGSVELAGEVGCIKVTTAVGSAEVAGRLAE